MDRALLDRLQPHLEAGEEVLWAGAPDMERARPLHLRQAIAAGVGTALFLLVGSAAATWVAYPYYRILETEMGTTTPDVLMVLLSLMQWGLGCSIPPIVFALVYGWTRVVVPAGKEFYAITDRAILAVGSKAHRFSLAEAYSVWVRHHIGGTGSIVFFNEWVRRRKHSANPEFRLIADVDRVVAIAQEAAWQAGYADPAAPLAPLSTGELVIAFWVEWLRGRRTPVRSSREDEEGPALLPDFAPGRTLWWATRKALLLAVKALVLGFAWSKVWHWLVGFQDFSLEMYAMSLAFTGALDVWNFSRQARYRRLRLLTGLATAAMLVPVLLWFFWWNRAWSPEAWPR